MKKNLNLRANIALGLIFAFLVNTLGPLPQAHADAGLNLPAPGAMIDLSPAYQPVIIKGLTVHKDNPFLFDFIVDVGQDKMSGEPLKKEGEKLIKYFLASLAIPDRDLWVNLSPYEKNRVIPEALGQTDMGRDLLEQDYILKQITASLIYPEKKLGRDFWEKVYSKAREMYGTTQVPVNTFNKVWIMADKAEVFEHNQTAFVVDSHLKVMLEEDYLALQKHSLVNGVGRNDIHSVGANIVRTIILPELEKEVNTGRNFANLRQIFNSLILASWYKNNLKTALLNQLYTDKEKIKGIALKDTGIKEAIYQRYLQAYRKGVFNFIKDTETPNGVSGPRKYFSGGIDPAMADHPEITHDPAMINRVIGSGALVVMLAGFLTSSNHSRDIPVPDRQQASFNMVSLAVSAAVEGVPLPGDVVDKSMSISDIFLLGVFLGSVVWIMDIFSDIGAFKLAREKLNEEQGKIISQEIYRAATLYKAQGTKLMEDDHIVILSKERNNSAYGFVKKAITRQGLERLYWVPGLKIEVEQPEAYPVRSLKNNEQIPATISRNRIFIVRFSFPNEDVRKYFLEKVSKVVNLGPNEYHEVKGGDQVPHIDINAAMISTLEKRNRRIRRSEYKKALEGREDKEGEWFIEHPDMDIIRIGEESSAFGVKSYVFAIIKNDTPPNELLDTFFDTHNESTVMHPTTKDGGDWSKISEGRSYKDQIVFIAFSNDAERDNFLYNVVWDTAMLSPLGGDKARLTRRQLMQSVAAAGAASLSGIKPAPAQGLLKVIRAPKENNVIFMEHEYNDLLSTDLPLLKNAVEDPGEYLQDKGSWERFVKNFFKSTGTALPEYRHTMEVLKQIIRQWKIRRIGIEMSGKGLQNLSDFIERMDKFRGSLKSKGIQGVDKIIDDINLSVAGPAVWLAISQPEMGLALVPLESDSRINQRQPESAELNKEYLYIQREKEEKFEVRVIGWRIARQEGNFLALLDRNTMKQVIEALPKDQGILEVDHAMTVQAEKMGQLEQKLEEIRAALLKTRKLIEIVSIISGFDRYIRNNGLEGAQGLEMDGDVFVILNRILIPRGVVLQRNMNTDFKKVFLIYKILKDEPYQTRTFLGYSADLDVYTVKLLNGGYKKGVLQWSNYSGLVQTYSLLLIDTMRYEARRLLEVINSKSPLPFKAPSPDLQNDAEALMKARFKLLKKHFPHKTEQQIFQEIKSYELFQVLWQHKIRLGVIPIDEKQVENSLALAEAYSLYNSTDPMYALIKIIPLAVVSMDKPSGTYTKILAGLAQTQDMHRIINWVNSLGQMDDPNQKIRQRAKEYFRKMTGVDPAGDFELIKPIRREIRQSKPTAVVGPLPVAQPAQQTVVVSQPVISSAVEAAPSQESKVDLNQVKAGLQEIFEDQGLIEDLILQAKHEADDPYQSVLDTIVYLIDAENKSDLSIKDLQRSIVEVMKKIERLNKFDSFRAYFNSVSLDREQYKKPEGPPVLKHKAVTFDLFTLKNGGYLAKGREVDEDVRSKISQALGVIYISEHGKSVSGSQYAQNDFPGVYRIRTKDNGRLYFRYFKGQNKAVIIAFDSADSTHAPGGGLRKDFFSFAERYSTKGLSRFEDVSLDNIDSLGKLSVDAAMQVKAAVAQPDAAMAAGDDTITISKRGVTLGRGTGVKKAFTPEAVAKAIKTVLGSDDNAMNAVDITEWHKNFIADAKELQGNKRYLDARGVHRAIKFYEDHYGWFTTAFDPGAQKALLDLLAGVIDGKKIRSVETQSPRSSFIKRLLKAREESAQKDPTQTAKGGIDLNPDNINWNIHKDGNGVAMTVDPATIERIRHTGINSLTPVIFRITPVTDIRQLAGV